MTHLSHHCRRGAGARALAHGDLDGHVLLFCQSWLLDRNPIAGTIIKPEEGKFSGGLIFSATMVFAGAVAFASIAVLKKRSKP